MHRLPTPLLRRKYAAFALKGVGVAALGLLPAAVPVTCAHAQSAEAKGLAIAREADRRDTGWKDSVVLGRMTLRNAQGQESARYFKLTSFEKPSDGDRSIIVFSRPADIANAAINGVARPAMASGTAMIL